MLLLFGSPSPKEQYTGPTNNVLQLIPDMCF